MDDSAKQLLRPGVIGIIPTDTVYGIVARVADKVAVSRLYALKSRDKKPGTIIAASIDQLVDLGIKRRYLTAVKEFWPGALSVEIPYSDDHEYLHLGTNKLAVRVADNRELSEILKATGPLMTTSANPPGEPVANNVDEAKTYFGKSVDFYIDGGERVNCQPSTVIRIVDDAIEVIRQGAVIINQ